MRTLSLAGTDVATTALGLGCASLFRLPGASDRRVVLEAAFDAGIRHFDVAPMYGLGLAESELAAFMRGRRESLTVATKFGINPTPLGRMAGRTQRPVRTALSRLPRVGNGIRKSGRGPTSGLIGKLLYAPLGYSTESARLSLDRSLKMLGTDYIDVFLLHDPRGDLLPSAPDLAAYLDSQVDQGRIRCWGVAGDTIAPDGVVRAVSHLGQALQSRDDIFEDLPDGAGVPIKARITFGIMERALPAMRHYFDRSPQESRSWSDRLGIDVSDQVSLPNLLVRHALHRNTTGPVLFSSTRADRVRAAARQADAEREQPSTSEESHAVASLADVLKVAYPRSGLN